MPPHRWRSLSTSSPYASNCQGHGASHLLKSTAVLELPEQAIAARSFEPSCTRLAGPHHCFMISPPGRRRLVQDRELHRPQSNRSITVLPSNPSASVFSTGEHTLVSLSFHLMSRLVAVVPWQRWPLKLLLLLLLAGTEADAMVETSSLIVSVQASATLSTSPPRC
jgi:hypothetical protein